VLSTTKCPSQYDLQFKSQTLCLLSRYSYNPAEVLAAEIRGHQPISLILQLILDCTAL